MKKVKKLISPYFLLFVLIVVGGFGLRIYNVNWDDGYYFHPDELHMYSVTMQLKTPNSWAEFWDTESSLNPKFFAYGSLPLYLLKTVSHVFSLYEPSYETYTNLYLIARPLSALFDSLTIILVYMIAVQVGLTMRWRLAAAAIYALAVFPIQNAHFYTVDTQLTFWTTCTLMLSLTAIHKKRTWPLFLAAIATGLALSTKITAIALVPIVLMSLIIVRVTTRTSWLRFALTTVGLGILLVGITSIVTLVTQPYVAIDYPTFVRDVTQQIRMRADAHVFPYTIQYLDTKPYLYPAAQIIQWGLGPLIGLLAFGGIGVLCGVVVRGLRNKTLPKELFVLLICFLLFFIPLGSSAVKFMRYYLPLYPILVITAIYALYMLFKNIRLPFQLLLGGVVGGSYLLWTAAFMSIYTTPHPWVNASDWINAQIPEGATIAIEHWDRGLPVWGMSRYNVETLELYHPDSPTKINTLIQQLERSDYIIIASNRLHASIPKWPERYPATIAYYDQLLSGQLGFEKIAVFESYPQFLGIRIKDAKADESFTVYDHPQALIFKKTTFDAENTADVLREVVGN